VTYPWRRVAVVRSIVAVLGVLGVIGVLCGDLAAQMDPRQVSGIPRPVDDLPTGSVSVRVIKGDMTHNLANQPVELQVGGETKTVTTDAEGRAQFDKLPAGTPVTASTVADGEKISAQTFPAPAVGGIRLLLFVPDSAGESAAQAAAEANAVTGTVVFGGDSRLIIEPGDETLSYFFLLEVVNNAKTPVNPPATLQFDLPSGSTNGAIMQGSTPRASVQGSHVRILGPFEPGKTTVDVAGEIPVTKGTIELAQTLPAAFEQLIVVAKKEGDLKIASPLLSRIQDTVIEGTPVVIGMGTGIPAGQPFTVTVSGLPHHSNTPRYVALSLAGVILIGGLVLGARPAATEEDSAERKKMTARRERLLQDLVRLEHEQRRGQLDAETYRARREALMKSLEQVYGALDVDASDEEIVRAAGPRRPLRPLGAS
jgi:hypothetical protein